MTAFFQSSSSGNQQEIDISPFVGILSGLLSESQVDNLENIVKIFDKVFTQNQNPGGSNFTKHNSSSSESSLPYSKFAEDAFYHFYFDVPGATKEDIKLSLSEERDLSFLKIVYVRKPLSKLQVFYNEQCSGEQSRMLQLPQDVDLSKSISTRYENGVLHVKIARAVARSNHFRNIPIL